MGSRQRSILKRRNQVSNKNKTAFEAQPRYSTARPCTHLNKRRVIRLLPSSKTACHIHSRTIFPLHILKLWTEYVRMKAKILSTANYSVTCYIQYKLHHYKLSKRRNGSLSQNSEEEWLRFLAMAIPERK